MNTDGINRCGNKEFSISSQVTFFFFFSKDLFKFVLVSLPVKETNTKLLSLEGGGTRSNISVSYEEELMGLSLTLFTKAESAFWLIKCFSSSCSLRDERYFLTGTSIQKKKIQEY